MEPVIFIVCAIFAFIFKPFVDRIIRKKVSTKWQAIALTLFIYWIIFLALYGIAALLGFSMVGYSLDNK